MQKEITSHIPLLDENGQLNCPGFAKKLYWQYDRKAGRAACCRCTAAMRSKQASCASRSGIITI